LGLATRLEEGETREKVEVVGRCELATSLEEDGLPPSGG